MIHSLPILGFAAYSGTGKTTLLEALLPKLTRTGLRIGMLKHAHHNFDVDKEGKDSYRLRKAGATQMLISSRYRYALMTETPDSESEFSYLLSRFDASKLDVILVEGCKNIAFPKIELHREPLNKPWLYPNDDNIIAVASDSPSLPTQLPQLDINNLDEVAQFVCDYVTAFRTQSKAVASEPVPASCDSVSPAMLSVTEAQQKILTMVATTEGTQQCQLEDISNQVLAETIISAVNVPQHTNSAMDGYAIRSDDLNRDSYEIVGHVMAGDAYSEPLQPGQSVGIMTGAPTPQYGDTVVMREQAETGNDKVRFTTTAIKPGQNVRQAGEDLAEGATVFTKGQRLQAPEVGMLASLGIQTCRVYKPIKIAIFSTGNEVQAPGSELQPNAIYDSNRYSIRSVLEHLGCEVLDLGILPDDESLIIDALRQASEQVDAIITSGGVSVGDADFIKSAIAQLGEIDFWRINMRPGRPLAVGRINHKPLFGLPGNPVAVIVSLLNFVEPAIRKMQGEQNWQPLVLNAIAAESLRSRQGRTEFSRGICSINDNGQLCVETTGKQGSGILRSMSEANCLIEITPEVDTVKVGEQVRIIPLQGRL